MTEAIRRTQFKALLERISRAGFLCQYNPDILCVTVFFDGNAIAMAEADPGKDFLTLEISKPDPDPDAGTIFSDDPERSTVIPYMRSPNDFIQLITEIRNQ